MSRPADKIRLFCKCRKVDMFNKGGTNKCGHCNRILTVAIKTPEKIAEELVAKKLKTENLRKALFQIFVDNTKQKREECIENYKAKLKTKKR